MSGEFKIFTNNKLRKYIEGNFKILHLLSWATVGAYNPFVVVFLMYNNVDTVQIGIILMLNSIATLIGQPLWGMISDKIRSIKKVYLFCISLSTVFILLLPFLKNEYVIFAFFPLISFFFCCMSPLLDSWTIHSIKNSGRSYGSFRLWGSIGYSIIVIIVGKLVSLTFVNIIFLVYGILSIITLVTCATMFNYDDESKDIMLKQGLSLKELNVGRLLSNYYFVTFVILSCLMFMTLSSVYSFLPTLMKQVGGSDELYGIATAISAFSEVPIFFISSRLVQKFKPQVLILTGMIVFALRLFIYSIAWSPSLVILAQALNGMSYAMFLAGSIYYIDSLAPLELKATAQTIATAIYVGLSGIIGNFVTGYIIEQYGIFFVYKVGTIVDLIVVVLFLVSLLVGKNIKRLQPIS